MKTHALVEHWDRERRNSLRMLPVATAMFLALAAVVYCEGLHRTDAGFLCGVLVGTTAFWMLLEAGTVLRLSRQIRAANASAAAGGAH